VSNALLADLVAYIGATGSGKTLLIKAALREGGAPLMVWSPKEALDKYAPEFGERIDGNPSQLVEAVSEGAALVYVPNRSDAERLARQFSLFCGLALAVGHRRVLVEEMSLVASSRSSPQRWVTLVTEGRAHGLALRAATNRPQLCDASLLDAATEIYCGRMNRGGSQKIMADAMGGLPLDRVRALAQLQFLHWRAGFDAVELVQVATPAARRRRRP